MGRIAFHFSRRHGGRPIATNFYLQWPGASCDQRTPAAMAEPMTPATLGAMACISRKLWRIFLLAHHLHDPRGIGYGGDSRRAYQGIDFIFQKQVHQLGEQHAAGGGDGEGRGPREQRSGSTSACRKLPRWCCADAEAQQDRDNVDHCRAGGVARRSVTMHSFIRLPKNSMPIRTNAPGASKVQIRKAAIGKMIRSRRETFREGFMRIKRSSRVVSSRMMGGWITGTRAMYE